MSGNPEVEMKGNLVVRIDQDSDTELQALFDSVLKPNSKRPLQVPLRMRKLPDSFFNPPSTGSKSPSVSSISHSRENSADSAVFSTPATSSGSGAGGLQVNHPRAHSSPASLQQTYASGPAAPQQSPSHPKQRSYDVAAGGVLDELGPLPHGWEQARTSEGQIYYLNHLTQTTTWEDPRKSAAAQVQAQLTSVASPPHPSTSPQPRPAQHLQRAPGGLLPQTLAWLQPVSEQATQQKIRLQSLQMERERLKIRQQEIMRQQEMMLRATSGDGGVTTGMDPFLSGLAEHSRQESADSGLGLGNNYSLPQTPDDFLSAMDDNMDGVSEDMASLDSHDMTSLSDNIDSTDDLVPSLQLGEEFTSDILDDVQALINPISKGGNSLTWL